MSVFISRSFGPRVLPARWGLFALALLAAGAAAAQTIALNLTVSKSCFFVQTNDTTPQPMGSTPWAFEAQATPAADRGIVWANLTPPGGTAFALTNSLGSTNAFWSGAFSNEAALTLAFPPGTYQAAAVLSSGDESFALSVNLSGPEFLNAPTILNLPAAQSIQATNPFTLEWELVNGIGGNDTILLSLEDESGSQVFQTSFAPATSADRWAVISANTLRANQNYRGVLIFSRVADFNLGFTESFSFWAALASFSKGTEFWISTKPPVIRLRLEPSSVLPGGCDLRFNAEKDRTYDILASDNLTDWMTLDSLTATSNLASYTDPDWFLMPFRFYRVLAR